MRLAAALALAALAALTVAAGAAPLTAAQKQRRVECRVLWQALAPASYRPTLCDYFIGEHERAGIGAEWYASFAYGLANADLALRTVFPGPCFGPMDCQFGSYSRQAGCSCPDDLRDPWRNIRAHVIEAKVGVGLGYHDLALCRYIMQPGAPTDWGGGQFAQAWARMNATLRTYYLARRRK